MRKVAIILILIGLSASKAIAQETEDPERNNPINVIGREIGSDRPELREDVRQTRNVFNTVASVVEEFTGVNARRPVGYLNLLLDLFRRRPRPQESPSIDIAGDGTINPAGPLESESVLDSDSGELNEVVGAVGLPDPSMVNTVIANNVQQPEGDGSAFSVSYVPTVRFFQQAANLNLNREVLETQLGQDGQALNASILEQLGTAAEGANTVAEEAQQAVATIDVLRILGKNGALNAAIGQINATETQQVKLAQQQANQSLLSIQEMMLQQDFRETVNRSSARIRYIKAALSFGGAFRGLDEEE